MMKTMNCFCGMVDRRKAFSLISSRDHCQKSSPSRIFDTPQAGLEPAQNLSSGLVQWSCAVVITTTPQRHCKISDKCKVSASQLCNNVKRFIHLLLFLWLFNIFLKTHISFCYTSNGTFVQDYWKCIRSYFMRCRFWENGFIIYCN